MLKKLLILPLLISLFGCNKESKKDEYADLNIYITSTQKIDSVFISNISQDREFYIFPFSDTLKVDLKDSINDMYNVWLYSEGKQYSGPNNQFWLSGENIIIKGTLDTSFKVDTVIGSNIYYKGKDFKKQYFDFYRKKTSAKQIDSFLISFTKDNLDNLISLESANYYYFRNKNDKEKIQTLKEVIAPHLEAYKNHKTFNVHKSIDKLLSLKKIDISKYEYVSVDGNPAKIKLSGGKKYLLDLWFMNCKPCIKDHKNFKENPELLSESNVEMITLSIDDEQEKWSKFVKDNSYPWKNYRQKSYQGSMIEELIIELFPTYFLINSDGTIIQSFNAYNDVKKYLEEENS